MIKWWNIKFDENDIEIVKDSMMYTRITMGQKTKLLESEISEIIKSKYVCCVQNGTIALDIAIKSFNFKYDTNILLPACTWVATANAVLNNNIKVKLYEVNNDFTPNIDDINNKINNQTSAIIVVNLNGNANNLSEIRKICDQRKIKFIEDNAQGFLSKINDKYLGTFGDISCQSLGITKLITSGYGGFIATDNKKLCERIKIIRDNGTTMNSKQTINYLSHGMNYKYSDLLASIGVSQLHKRKEKIKRMLMNFDYLKNKLSKNNSIRLLEPVSKNNFPLWNIVLSNDRHRLEKILSKNNIETKRWYPPLNRNKILKSKEIFPISEKIFNEVLILPSGPDLRFSELNKGVKIIEYSL